MAAHKLYHLVQKDLWEASKAQQKCYYPPTYEQDGFIHLTQEAELLLGVANQFYQDVPGTFLVLALDPARLTSKVVFEPAAPVGSKAASTAQEAVLFPHLYGTIDFEAVNAELTVERAPSGAFLRIEGLPASTAS